MIKVSILGATGYTGQELARMLCQHPQVEIVGLGTQNYVEQSFAHVYPNFRGVLELPCKGIYDPELITKADVIFLALPHGFSAPLVEKIIEQGKRVIDLGADFRLKSPEIYAEWYKTVGPTKEQLAKAVYGLPEINREKIKTATVIANPGCYPTTIILGLAPLLKQKIIDKNFIIIDSKSGVSGAGRSLNLTSLFCEVNEDFKAYGLPRHRHTPEIEQELGTVAGEEIQVTFTPHLLPMSRGMLSTIYAVLKEPLGFAEIEQLYKEFYKDEPFIRIQPRGEFPHTKWVLGTNYCDIGINVDERTGRITIISVIDNLVKGASGQALQNMNIMYGLDETLGLTRVALYP
ncbi:N-acetyl-gamma-glutamyl-phosphate reductase [Thermanaerosceptrum fracticalcis]|uniref:N-acetyl-gamma-glutamyl-phosphate reductase n=1 Tax=Thermanaerosceptrum fracticalcis TaxID=1712410 RepID=A0A7G6E5Y5_THEFR|nr:N-acetyl-gamma-glutamyl-phosphate reductase [Thermanaerosceptrum fracticalcis]QNB47489.1 N-acetyl-gamma-glutamyl-phosphate reductase [Thermanaerosceptrum fracticalcis]